MHRISRLRVITVGVVAGTMTGGFSLGWANGWDRLEGIHGEMPAVGESAARVLAPQWIELGSIGTPLSNGAFDRWDFVSQGTFTPPPAGSCTVEVNGVEVAHTVQGFRRRALYAPLAETDLRVEQRAFLRLEAPIPDGAEVTVSTQGWEGENSEASYTLILSPSRRSPAVHVNQEGYDSAGPKQAMVGYYLGSAGELEIQARNFTVEETASGQEVFAGTLTRRADQGYTDLPTPYQEVWQADFSALTTEGEYQLQVEGLGRSLPFRIDDHMMLGFARTYAHGLYQQRCGHAVGLPFSRHSHDACHGAAAAIPTDAAEFSNTWTFIAQANDDPSQVAPRLVSAATQLYPIQRSGPIDVSGGHHDAGDYSKYTINSAQLIHHLAFIADAVPATGALDHLGIPESGDGKSDLLQEAKIEADFLAKMQDSDGGFFFLVYPKDRKYEDDVLPDDGDPQVVWPKNTSATAAAVGALADLASSPRFQQEFPTEAADYLQKAQLGWQFLLQAIADHGLDGSYQKLTHYGHSFGHQDELAWAAAAMFAATGDPDCLAKLKAWYDPSSAAVRRWGWWALYEGYGCATRDYLFAVAAGKRQPHEMDADYLAQHRALQMDTGQWLRMLSSQGAYGSCLDPYSKRQGTAGWFFCSDRSFEITVSHLLEPHADNAAAVYGNANYEFGCNPLNLSYVTGSGWRRQREIVHQYAQNDDRILPPSGIPLGNIQSGFSWLARYGSQLGSVTFPGDGLSSGRYPFYDRWGDTFNTTTEFVVSQQARILANYAAWATQSPAASPAWHSAEATIQLPADYLPVGQPATATLLSEVIDLTEARVTWEWGGTDPWIGGTELTFSPQTIARHRIEAEAVLPDGRRISAVRWFGVKSLQGAEPLAVDEHTVALYSFDEDFTDSSAHHFDLTSTGKVELVDHAAGWMTQPSGKAVRFHGMGDQLSVTLPAHLITPEAGPTELVLEARICPLDYDAYGNGASPLFALVRAWNSKFGILQDLWEPSARPFIVGDAASLLPARDWDAAVSRGAWQQLEIHRQASGTYQLRIDGEIIASATSTQGPFGPQGTWTFTLGNFNGYLDDVRIRSVASSPPEPEDEQPDEEENDDPEGGPADQGSAVLPWTTPLAADADTVALYHFDGNYDDSSSHGFHLNTFGGAQRVPVLDAQGNSAGECLRLTQHGDGVSISLPDSLISPGSTPQPITLETWIYPRAYRAYGIGTEGYFSLKQNWDSSLAITQDKWLQPADPAVVSGATTILPQGSWQSHLTLQQWQHLMITRDEAGIVSFWVNGEVVASAAASINHGRVTPWTFRIADMDADLDEVRISRSVRIPPPPDRWESDASTIALYHFDGDFSDSGPHGLHLNANGGATRSADNLQWMQQAAGEVARMSQIGDELVVTIPDALLAPGNSPPELTLEARIYPRAYKAYGVATASILRLEQNWDSALGINQDKWLLPDRPRIMSGSHTVLAHSAWENAIPPQQWHHLKITHDSQGVVSVWVDDLLITSQQAQFAYSRTNDWTFKIGNIDADFDEVRISKIVR